MNKRVFFKFTSPGYAFPGDALGLPGALLDTKAGRTAEIKLMRAGIAECLYRAPPARAFTAMPRGWASRFRCHART